ncbi:MAG: (2Fe-2S)-binding protein [Xanthobacteraceae bacterium]|jgi:aerobic-type carbon monoxide dehydrogenase small subunit (CoxS/CutS family)
MTRSMDVALTINGEERMLRIEPFETLLTSLRDRLHLTAAKRGCNQGVCGACSVLIGGEPARACLSLTANCVDRDITTVEGLSTPLALSPLQAAMVRAGAIQCGFCTPGMLVALTALLKECPQPTRQEIRQAVSSNLCRCTGYQKIVEAVVEMVGGGAA